MRIRIQTSLKRATDITFSFIGLTILMPVMVCIALAIWSHDKRSPFYIANRVGKFEKEFKMFKFRSMVVAAELTGVDSTASNDHRITRIGRFVRKYKFDELPQLWNVLRGDMSLIGPRPNVRRETDLYTEEEKQLLSIKPGITDFASIVFSDEGEILQNQTDPDLAYNQLIRPGKSRLGLVYIENHSLVLDFYLMLLTLISRFSRQFTLKRLSILMQKLTQSQDLIDLCLRIDPLKPSPPPGSSSIVISRSTET